MTQTIIDLAHNLGKQVIAEGIETADQARVLETMGCDQAQGFYYARPADSAEIPALLARCQGVLPERRVSSSCGANRASLDRDPAPAGSYRFVIEATEL